MIDENGGFTQQNGVLSGNGTASDPYVIGGWWIDESPGIAIRNTDSYFLIRSVRGSSGINMTNVSNGKVDVSFLFSGVTLDSSRNMTFSLDGGSQIRINSSRNIIVSQDYFSQITVNSSRGIIISQDDVSQIDIISSSDFTISESTGTEYIDGIPRQGYCFVTISSSDNATLTGNKFYTLNIERSTRLTVKNNTVTRDIGVRDSTRLTIENNTVTMDIAIRGVSPEQFDSNLITADNKVDGGPLLFYTDCSGLDLDSIEAGELIVANCSGVRITNITSAQLETAFVSNSLVDNLTGAMLITRSTATKVSNIQSSLSVESSSNILVSSVQGGLYVESSLNVISHSVGGIGVSSSTNVSVSDSVGGGVYGFTAAIFDSNYVSISGNSFSCNIHSTDCTGLTIYNSEHVSISANSFSEDVGLDAENSSFLEISSNLIQKSVTGAIVLNSCSNVSIKGNRVPGVVDEYYGVIRISDCNGLNIYGNTLVAPLIFCEYYCISPLIHNFLKVSQSSNIVIVRNTISNSINAINIEDSSNATINANNIQSSVQGVVLNDTTNVLVFHNNFINNTGQSSDTYSSQNRWDNGYPSGGNYWSDSSHIDSCNGPQQNICTGRDGIADTPYSFSTNEDRYPLTKPFGPQVVGNLSFSPPTIRLQSPAKYLVATISLPSGFNVSNLVLSSIRLNDTLSTSLQPHINIQTNNGISNVAVMFDMTQVRSLLRSPGDYVLQITANILTQTNFRPFAASTTVRVQSG